MEDVDVVVAAAAAAAPPPPPPPPPPLLPPGFRFQPTDEELITHYLAKKVVDVGFLSVAVGEVDLNKCEPWDLPLRAKMGEKEWYFFCVRDRKYPTGLRTNRATKAGYWKATGKDSAIYRGKSLVGMKKTLVFYRGRAPKGEKSNWVMHEYRLEGKYYSLYNLSPKIAKNEWVVCRVFHKIPAAGIKKPIKADVSLPRPPAPPMRPEPACTFDAAYVTCFSNATVPSTGTFDDHLDDVDYFRSPTFLPAPEPPRRPPLFLSMMPSLLPPALPPPPPPAPATAELASLAGAEAAASGGHILLLDHCLWNC